MLAKLRSHLTFANVVSLMALFVALSGGAYALTIPKGSVGAKQLKRNAVTRSKIKNGAVTSSTVKDNSLLAKDFKLGQLPAGPRGATGPQGETGPQGSKGDAGPPGTARAYAYVNAGATPSFDAARTKGFAEVSKPATGVYCLTPDPTIDLSTTVVAVTPVWNSGILNNAFAQLTDVKGCASGQLDVFTYYDSGEFPIATDGIDFTVVVP